MNKPSFPLSLARNMLRLMPPQVLARGTQVMVKRMERRHPKLFKNVALLDPAYILFKPTDLPHQFVLRTGTNPDFYYSKDTMEKPDASISGSLKDLIDMMEGRVDGDTLFFSRNIRITGDTTAIVGLRNTLDREEIDLYQEVLSLCGPFAQPLSVAAGMIERLLLRIDERKDS